MPSVTLDILVDIETAVILPPPTRSRRQNLDISIGIRIHGEAVILRRKHDEDASDSSFCSCVTSVRTLG